MKHFPGIDIISKNLEIHDLGVYLIYGPKLSGKLHYCNNFISRFLGFLSIDH